MTKELIDFEVEGKIFKVYKLHGNGFCTCKSCFEKTGWSWEWTDSCYMYKDQIYCYKCIKEVLKNEKEV